MSERSTQDSLVTTTEKKTPAPAREVSPSTDVHETPEAIVLEIDVPGLDHDGLELRLEDSVLSLRGEVPQPTIEGQAGLREFPRKLYRRNFQLPPETRFSDIEAQLTNGVLTVTLPKAEEAKPRRIAIR